MSDHIRKTIEELHVKLREHEENVKRTKRMINDLCVMDGADKIYLDIDEATNASVGPLRGDEYYGKGQATAVREYLMVRKQRNEGPATIDDIYAALEKGGYQFEEKMGKRGMSIAISKNTQTFHKLPNGKIGLREWYPEIKDGKNKKGNEEKSGNGSPSASSDETEESDPSKEQ